MAKWLKHLTVDQKSQVRIPPVASRVKCFFTPPPLGRPGAKINTFSSVAMAWLLVLVVAVLLSSLAQFGQKQQNMPPLHTFLERILAGQEYLGRVLSSLVSQPTSFP